jgi:DNA-binding transcriptional MerR regulator
VTSDTSASDAARWRIDELAHRSGVSVDTIRFYQREGLLDPPVRTGRTAVYAPTHLHRLEQIRELQSRHLSLAAIRGLLATERIGLAESLFAAGQGDYTPTQLAALAGVDRDLVDELEKAGVLRPPGELGRESYDDADARLLAAIARMLELGLPRPLVVRLGQLYSNSFNQMQQQVLELFTRGADVLDGTDLDAFHEHIADHLGEVLKPVQAMLDYAHTRSVQVMTMQALERTDLGFPGPRPGGRQPRGSARNVISRRAKTQRSPAKTNSSR